MKFLKDFRFVFQQVNPRKFTEIIDETNIIIVSSNRGGSWSPYIRKIQVQKKMLTCLLILDMATGGFCPFDNITNRRFIWLGNKGNLILAKDLRT
jgi:hypothetical protein